MAASNHIVSTIYRPETVGIRYYSPYISTFQEVNENQRRKTTKEWVLVLNVGDWIRYSKLKLNPDKRFYCLLLVYCLDGNNNGDILCNIFQQRNIIS